MDWKSTRLLICLLGMSCDQWALVARLIGPEVWMSVMLTCLAGFGITKVVEYAKSGRAPSAAELPAPPDS
ncbi:MAG TPA: hypothetical protein VMY37_13270 [Thermoguttaceae bacterium]|nr:hypothetical protein [Thermoguttaceae bacterium]HUW30856.1 hypothetical protein [Planctomycetota bacterium]